MAANALTASRVALTSCVRTICTAFVAIPWHATANPAIMRQICSVLAGYVWDLTNPYVAQPERALPLLSGIVRRRLQRPALEQGPQQVAAP